jgi:hypothetical protein
MVWLAKVRARVGPAEAGRFSKTEAGEPKQHPSSISLDSGCIVDELDRAGFVVMKQPAIGEGAALAPGYER